MKEEKKFCDNCKHYRYYDYAYDGRFSEFCLAPENKKTIISYKNEHNTPEEKPSVLNKNNDCKYYRRKKWFQR